MARLVIVSNRVPIPKTRGAQAGGLAVALKDVLVPGCLWFGWSGRIGAETSTVPSIVEARGVTYATIDLSSADHKQFYIGFANGALWPLFHFRLGLLRFRREDYEGYLSVNRAFAQALAKVLKPDDLVWVHDFHLIPLARFLRELGVKNRLGFFLHIPFVPPSVLLGLPTARELLADLCAYDVTGFQTEEHASDFRDGAVRILGARSIRDTLRLQRRTARVLVDPIGIDAVAFEREAVRSAEAKPAKSLVDSLVGRALAIGIDRLDYSKGLTNKFEGYARLLSRYPEHLRKVSLLQIAPRSREEVDEYRLLRIELDRLAGNVNGRYSDFDWVPLRYSTRSMPRSTIAGFFRRAHLCLVTPLRDGMNLVAKEFIAAQDPADPGVLILSRFAGAAEQLTDALIVNPFDPDEIADAMHQGLLMPLDERRLRHRALRGTVFTGTASAYSKRFLAALAGAARSTPRPSVPSTGRDRDTAALRH